MGTGGLIVAYKSATADCLAGAEVETRTFDVVMVARYPYVAMNGVMRVLKDSEARVERQAFDVECELVLRVRKGDAERVRERLTDVEGVEVSEEV